MAEASLAVSRPLSLQRVEFHKVDRAYEPDGEEQRPASQKHNILKTGTAATARHRAWLRRNHDKAEKGKSAWRPRTMYRLASRRVARMWDNHFRVSTTTAELLFFQKKKGYPSTTA